MQKRSTFFTRVTGLMAFMLAFAASAQAQEASIERVEAEHVCMVNERHYENVQIPVPVGDKTYYGCCQGCVTELENNPESRTATDPVTGSEVDKATAVIGALPDGSVRYFESEETLQQFAESDGK